MGKDSIQEYERLFFKIRILFFFLLSVFIYQICVMFQSQRNFSHEYTTNDHIEIFYLLYTCILVMLCGMLVLR